MPSHTHNVEGDYVVFPPPNDGEVKKSQKSKGSPPTKTAGESSLWDKTDEDYLIEIKSRNDNKKSLHYLPRTENLVQWNLYSVMTNVVKGLIFYVNKNTQEYNIYETQRNNKIVDKIFNKM